MNTLRHLFSTVLCIVLLLFGAPTVFAQTTEPPLIDLQLLDGGGQPLSGNVRLRVSLWNSPSLKPGDFNPDETINTSSPNYAGFEANFIVQPQTTYFQDQLVGRYRFDLIDLAGFPSSLTTNNAYLQVEYKSPPGNPNNGYTVYDFVEEFPDQGIIRLQIIDDDTVLITPDAGNGTLFDAFVLDANNDALSTISIQFGEILGEAFQWDIANNYFFLSDALVIDGTINTQGSLIRLGFNDPTDADRDIVAVQGVGNDGVLRYSATNDRWEISNDGGAFEAIATGTGGGGSSLFGSEYQYEESDAVTTMTSTIFQQKLRLTTPSLPAGRYRLGWSYQWNHDSAANDFEARVQYNDSLDVMVHVQEPADAAGTFGATGTDQQHQVSGFKHGNLPAGVHTFDLDFRTTSSGVESSIWNARLELWRVE